jgi:YbbR domain-containing protein
MDKFMESHWFLKGIALLFALLLFLSFGLERDPNRSDLPFTKDKKTEKSVPVLIENYDTENTIVAGIPETVDITFEGPSNIVTATALVERKFQVYVDLKDLELGTHTVELQHRNVSEKLTVSIEPKTIEVHVYEKVEKDFPVTISYSNEELIKPGYVLQGATTKPERVEVSGPKEQIERVDKVKVSVDVKNADKSFEKELKLNAYDAKGTPLPAVTVKPQSVKVMVNITLPSKKVPVVPTKKGTAPEGIKIDDLEAEVKEVTIFGMPEELNKVTSLPVEVDVTGIKENSVVQGEVLLPEGIKGANLETIKVRVKVKKEETKTVNNITIKPIGLSDNFTINFVSPPNGTIALDIFGFQDIIDSVTAKEVEAYVDVSNLSPGTHELPLQVKGPQNVKIDIQNKKVKFNIVKNEA